MQFMLGNNDGGSDHFNVGQSPELRPDKECLGAQEGGKREGSSPHLNACWETGGDCEGCWRA